MASRSYDRLEQIFNSAPVRKEFPDGSLAFAFGTSAADLREYLVRKSDGTYLLVDDEYGVEVLTESLEDGDEVEVYNESGTEYSYTMHLTPIDMALYRLLDINCPPDSQLSLLH